jgi:hypothetical protein
VASWIVAFVPVCLALAIIVSEAYVRLSLGTWRVAYRDTVHARFAGATAHLTVISALAVLPSTVLLPIVGLSRFLLRVRPVFGRWTACFSIGWVVAFLLVMWDPTGFVDWVMD